MLKSITQSSIFVAIAIISQANKQAMHIESILHNYVCTWLCFPKNPYTLTRFEAGYSVLEADAMPTAPRRQG
jgi:hypothetical protein